jgi:hypothetical protein
MGGLTDKEIEEDNNSYYGLTIDKLREGAKSSS